MSLICQPTPEDTKFYITTVAVTTAVAVPVVVLILSRRRPVRRHIQYTAMRFISPTSLDRPRFQLRWKTSDWESSGEATAHLVPRFSQSPGEIKRREVVPDPQVSPEEIKSREVELGLKDGLLLPQLFLSSGATDIVFVTVPHSI